MSAKVREPHGQTTQFANDDLGRLLNEWFEKHGPTAIYKTCENCKHMPGGDAPAFCTLYQMTPPARVILTGCPSHDDCEEIPF